MSQKSVNFRQEIIEKLKKHYKSKEEILTKNDENAKYEEKTLFDDGKKEAKREDEHYFKEVVKSIKNKNKRYKKDTQLREKYARKVHCFMYAYFTLVMAIIFFQGFSIWSFKINDMALTALIGSAFVSAVGLVGFVVQGLFPKHNKD